MTLCQVLKKVRYIPGELVKFLRDSDILFRSAEHYILVDDTEPLDKPYEIYDEHDRLLRVDKRILKELDDLELTMVLFHAKMVRDAFAVTGKRDFACDVADDLLEKRYTSNKVSVLQEKLDNIYNQV